MEKRAWVVKKQKPYTLEPLALDTPLSQKIESFCDSVKSAFEIVEPAELYRLLQSENVKYKESIDTRLKQSEAIKEKLTQPTLKAIEKVSLAAQRVDCWNGIIKSIENIHNNYKKITRKEFDITKSLALLAKAIIDECKQYQSGKLDQKPTEHDLTFVSIKAKKLPDPTAQNSFENFNREYFFSTLSEKVNKFLKTIDVTEQVAIIMAFST